MPLSAGREGFPWCHLLLLTEMFSASKRGNGCSGLLTALARPFTGSLPLRAPDWNSGLAFL